MSKVPAHKHCNIQILHPHICARTCVKAGQEGTNRVACCLRILIHQQREIFGPNGELLQSVTTTRNVKRRPDFGANVLVVMAGAVLEVPVIVLPNHGWMTKTGRGARDGDGMAIAGTRQLTQPTHVETRVVMLMELSA